MFQPHSTPPKTGESKLPNRESFPEPLLWTSIIHGGTLHRYKSEMDAPMTTIKSTLLCLACVSLSSCAGDLTAGERIADMPHWMGGLPAGAPPRRGTPEYEEFMAKRAQERRGRRPSSSNLSRRYLSSSG